MLGHIRSINFNVLSMDSQSLTVVVAILLFLVVLCDVTHNSVLTYQHTYNKRTSPNVMRSEICPFQKFLYGITSLKHERYKTASINLIISKIFIGRMQIDLLKRKITSAYIRFYFFSLTFQIDQNLKVNLQLNVTFMLCKNPFS